MSMSQHCVLHVFLHSNASTGEPSSADVLNVFGVVNLDHLYEATVLCDQVDWSEYLFGHIGELDVDAYVAGSIEIEDAFDPPQAYFQILRVIDKDRFEALCSPVEEQIRGI